MLNKEVTCIAALLLKNLLRPIANFAQHQQRQLRSPPLQPARSQLTGPPQRRQRQPCQCACTAQQSAASLLPQPPAWCCCLLCLCP